MNTLAEHLLDPTLATVDQPGFDVPALHIQHQRAAVTVAAAVFFIPEGGTPVVLVNGMFRPAQFEALATDVARLNADPAAGWASLALATATNAREEADQLRSRAEALSARADRLEAFAH